MGVVRYGASNEDQWDALRRRRSRPSAAGFAHAQIDTGAAFITALDHYGITASDRGAALTGGAHAVRQTLRCCSHSNALDRPVTVPQLMCGFELGELHLIPRTQDPKHQFFGVGKGARVN
jgi:hypothetical protein